MGVLDKYLDTTDTQPGVLGNYLEPEKKQGVLDKYIQTGTQVANKPSLRPDINSFMSEENKNKLTLEGVMSGIDKLTNTLLPGYKYAKPIMEQTSHQASEGYRGIGSLMLGQGLNEASKGIAEHKGLEEAGTAGKIANVAVDPFLWMFWGEGKVPQTLAEKSAALKPSIAQLAEEGMSMMEKTGKAINVGDKMTVMSKMNAVPLTMKERLWGNINALKEVVKNTIGLPRYILGDLAGNIADTKLYHIPEEAKKIYAESGIVDGRTLALKLTKKTRELVGAALNGTVHPEVLEKADPKAKIVYDTYRQGLDYLADYFKIPKGKRVEYYLRRFWKHDSDIALALEKAGKVEEADPLALNVGKMLSHVKDKRTGAWGYELDCVEAFDNLLNKGLKEKMLKPLLDEAAEKWAKQAGDSETMQWYKKFYLDIAQGKPVGYEKVLGKTGTKYINNFMNGTLGQVLNLSTKVALYHIPQMLNYGAKHPLYFLKGLTYGLPKEIFQIAWNTFKNASLKKGLEGTALNDPRLMQTFSTWSQVEAAQYEKFAPEMMSSLKKIFRSTMGAPINTAMYIVRGAVCKGAEYEFLAKNYKKGMDLAELIPQAHEYGIKQAGDAVGRFGRIEKNPIMAQFPGANMFLTPVTNQANLMGMWVKEDWKGIQNLYDTMATEGIVSKETAKKAVDFFKNDTMLKYLFFTGIAYAGAEGIDGKKHPLLKEATSKLSPVNTAKALSIYAGNLGGDIMQIIKDLDNGRMGTAGKVAANELTKIFLGQATINPNADYMKILQAALEGKWTTRSEKSQPIYDVLPWSGARQDLDQLTGFQRRGRSQ